MIGMIKALASRLNWRLPTPPSYSPTRSQTSGATWHLKGPIIVHQMGKVGSRTVYESLRRLSFNHPVYHSHRLNNLDEAQQNVMRMFTKPGPSLNKIQQAKKIRQLIDDNPTQRWLVITLVRDLVRRNLSAFFQNLDELAPDMQRRWESGEQVLDELYHLFFTKYCSDGPLSWFDTQVAPVFGIDVFSVPFPKEKGYGIIRGNRADLLVIRLEDLNRRVHEALEEFLGIRDFRLLVSNVSAEKWYRELYTQFVAGIQLPDNYLDRAYNSKLCRHFYSQAELASFRGQWSRQLAA